MMRNTHTYLWLMQLVTGILIVLFGGTHLVMMHLDNILGFFGVEIGEASGWEAMMTRAVQGFWLAFYIIFLVIALYHGLNGLRGVILELNSSRRWERTWTILIIVLGVVGLGLGVYVPAELFIS